jgi:glucose/arabinose dehydrogenase
MIQGTPNSHGCAARAIAAGLVLVLAGCGAAPGKGAAAARTFAPGGGLRLVEVARGLDRPLYVTAPAGDARLFIVEQPGRVKIVKNGKVLAKPFLDLTRRVKSGGERGLLSIAFDPDYARTGFFYVNFTDSVGDTHVERLHVSSDPDVANPYTAHLVLWVHQPYANHNGGHILFGPDGMRYVGMGDGGAGGDPHENGQNPNALLGKMLRLDVRADSTGKGPPYRIPADNPYAKVKGGAPEVWALGLRNPWRFCFDAPAGLIYIADVGQDKWEEVNVAPARAAGLNYGWNTMEGMHDFSARDRVKVGLTAPILEYGHDEGCSVTGGFVYRGRVMPSLVGTYFFADYCKGWVRSFRMSGGKATELREWSGLKPGNVTSFGVDGKGELYLTNGAGAVYRLAP